jgi:hypothetical protein
MLANFSLSSLSECKAKGVKSSICNLDYDEKVRAANCDIGAKEITGTKVRIKNIIV